MSAQALPEELLELIFDHIDEKLQLSRCSLVCRAWLFPSSRLLFRELNLQTQHESPNKTCRNWGNYFLRAVKASARMQNCVRKLSLSLPLPEFWHKWRVWPTSVLLETLRLFPNLKSITLTRLNFKHDTISSSLAPRCPEYGLSLDTVELHDVPSLSICHSQVEESGASESTGLAKFLGLFTSIRVLSIEDYVLPYRYPTIRRAVAPIPLPRQTPLKLEELHLKGESSAKMLGALKEMVDPRHLRVLFVELNAPVLSLANEFVGCMTALQTVRFLVREDLNETRPATVVNLSACAELKSISIPYLRNSGNQVEAINAYIGCTVVPILSTAPPSVRYIHLSLEMDPLYAGSAVLRRVDWTSFSRSLERFPELEVVELSSSGNHGWTSGMMEVVKGELSPATRRALQFT
ncbi:uncharacterized protein PHACADRAFT_203490 [Phanerochaete carnosa HHB-10118-sp]|uniref:F-box domain-containing protein n=1 Tax=Phanerochaete carnosa (strain HHB-10118-sp) TaxID=650164 RepID=K5WM28_PHACS|nr:uncharacterized protein PHACADRAFT_203490 [Phanerochaete carnosa HHB-10118-sp]EKM60244.1 hypothetical protein PHACADRAFT_203490 [Phanerochaete carnosa HHB-10118-sp]